jgi:hypothetical protein
MRSVSESLREKLATEEKAVDHNIDFTYKLIANFLTKSLFLPNSREFVIGHMLTGIANVAGITGHLVNRTHLRMRLFLEVLSIDGAEIMRTFRS